MTFSREGVGLSLQEALSLPAVARQNPELLTPSSGLDRTVRWVHIIGQDRPAHLLQGGELVLSTLPRMTEDRPDLAHVLGGYLADLDSVGVSALAVEVLENRPKLRRALDTVAAEREALSCAAELTPILLFSRVARFIDITQALHHELVAQQLVNHRSAAPAWDPIISATTNLLNDLAAPGSLPAAEAQERASALGMPRNAAYFPLSALLPGSPDESTEHQLSDLASAVRETAAQLRIPALVGVAGQQQLAVLLPAQERSTDLPGPAMAQTARRLCRGLETTAERRRTQQPLPRHLLASSERLLPLLDIWSGINEAAAIARSAELVTQTEADQDPAPRPHYWTADHLGVDGLLAHLAKDPQTAWFLRRYLDPLDTSEVPEAKEVIRAALNAGGNKAQMARDLQLSRPTLYARIDRLERALGIPLKGESLALLYMALRLEALSR